MSKRKKRRISRSAALFIPVSVLLIAFFTVFGVSIFTKIIDIEVAGATVYSEEEIIEASGISSGDNLLFVDVNAASHSIRAAKPFINKVAITRVPPCALRIEVTESTPMARIDYQNSVLVIDSDCRVLMITENAPDGLIEVFGISHSEPVEGSPLKEDQGSEIKLQSLKDILTIIKKEGIEKGVSYIDINTVSRIYLGYEGRFRVILGNPINARTALSKLQAFVLYIDDTHSTEVMGDIDMSDMTGPGRFNPK